MVMSAPHFARPRTEILRLVSRSEALDPVPQTLHSYETEVGCARLASNRRAVTFDGDPTANLRKTNGCTWASHTCIGKTGHSVEYYVGVGR